MTAETVRSLHKSTVSSGLAAPMVEDAVRYLLSHRGRWVPGWELADHLYQGVCSPGAVSVVIARARRRGVVIESSRPFGYRMGRAVTEEATCPRCGVLRVRYDEEWVCYGCPGTAVVDLEVGRVTSAGERSGRGWSDEERDRLRELWVSEMTQDAIGVELGRSGAAVRAEAAALGLGRKRYVRGGT